MSCISEQVAAEEDMSAGRRVALLTKLQDARRDLVELRQRRQAYLDCAEAYRAEAAEAAAEGRISRCIDRNAAAVRAQLNAEADWQAIWQLTQDIGSIERSLSAGPVVLTGEQVAAMDECAGVAV